MKKLFPSLLLSLVFFGSAQANALLDISRHTNEEAINYVYQEGIVSGYPDGTYKPDGLINRAEFTKIIVGTLFELKGVQACESERMSFSDVVVDEWYAPYVCVAWEEGIIKGYPDNTFRPSQHITFVEAAKIIDIAFGGEEIKDSVWYKPYVENLSDFAVIPTTITRLDKNITRGEMAEMIWRWEAEIESKDSMVYDQGELVAVKAGDVIFGVEAESEADCVEGEVFDAEYQMCFRAEDLKVQGDLDELLGDSDLSFSHDFKEEGAADEDVLIMYKVEGNTLEQEVVGKNLSAAEQAIVGNTRLHKRIWEQFYQLIPSHPAKDKIVRYVLIGGTGDNEGTLAYVHQLDEDPTKWVLGINVPENFNEDGTLKSKKDFYHTLIHEFFHVLSLEESNAVEAEKCETYIIETGCLKPDAPLGMLVEEFWKKSPHWEAFIKDPENQDGAHERYEETPERYVSEYAATNPGEDGSETFAYFVLNSKPKGNLVKEQKLMQMFEDSSLFGLRNAIRTNLTRMDGTPLRKRSVQR